MCVDRFLRFGLAAAILLTVLSSPALAQGDRLAPGPVEFRLRDTASAAAIADALVRLGGRFGVSGPDGLTVFDGVPAGEFDVEVVRRGFDRHEARLILAPGRRDPVEIGLRPSQVARLAGRITAGGERPVAGARISLQTERSRAGWPVRVLLHSGWDGAFELFDLPVGSYDFEVEAAGCEPRSGKLEVGPEPDALVVDLVPTRGTTSFEVLLRDSTNGAPVANAAVFIAEAWPRGLVARGTTSAEGRATFADIALGRRNWIDGEGAVEASGGHATVRVEAEGYESVVVPIPQRLGGSIEVALHPVTEIEESEPNDDIAAATPIRTGAPVRLTIRENGDHDHFRFRLDQPARLRVAVGPDLPVWVRVFLMRADGSGLAEASGNRGAEAIITADLPRGDFVILVRVYYDNESSESPFRLRVDREVAADPFEPNDSPGAARPLRIGEEVRGLIFPQGDRDHYRFETVRAGHVRLTMPPCDLWRRVHLLDEAGAQLGEAAADRGQPLELRLQLPAGRHVVLVHQYYDNQDSLDPYTLRLESIGDDGIDDPAEEVGAALRSVRAIDLDETVGTTIFPTGDIDRFALALPEPGLLHIRLASSVWGRLKLRARDGRILAETAADVGRIAETAWYCAEPQGVVIELRQYYDNSSSHLPNLITTWFEPADEIDVLGRNDGFEDAFPAFIGEPLRGSIQPVGDRDVHRLQVDHPGLLHLEGQTSVWTRMFVHDETGAIVGEAAADAGRPISLVVPVLPGEYFVLLRQYYDNLASAQPYVIRTRLERAAADEGVPLARGAARAIGLGELVPFAIEHHGDRDHFSFLVPREGSFFLRMRPTVWTRWFLVNEADGTTLREGGVEKENERVFEIKVAGPTRCRLELKQYYDNDSSMKTGWFVVDLEDRPLVGCVLVAKVDPCDPTAVTFGLEASDGVALPVRTMLDADGNGSDDVALSPGREAVWRYAAPGSYAARLKFDTADGRHGTAGGWVDALGTRPREGVQLILGRPAEGAVVERAEACRVRAVSYSGSPVRRVDFAIDGRTLASAFSAPFEVDLPWGKLGPGEHVLTLSAHDGAGNEGRVERRFSVSEYFDLLPGTEAVVTGDEVAVSWAGPAFGRAAVRYRVAGEESWQTREGQRARNRRIVLDDLEPEKKYEFQPLGDGEPGPIHTVTRVRGLAFGKARYAASIERDYDQRLGISIRNHADQPQRVRLVCGEPPEESRLLVGFVGEGSEGDPIDLAPGEEREFMLVMSAQDVVTPRTSFPIRLNAESGFTDEAEVDIDIRLPLVKLRWEEQEALDEGLRRVFVLHNEGDGLTDLRLRSENDDVYVSPELDHGVFPAGGRVRVEVSPRLYEGFTSVSGTIRYGAVNTDFEQDVALALPEGKTLYGLQLVAGAGIIDEGSTPDEILLAARSMAGTYLNPDSVDWTRRSNPEDGDGDGRIDRWSIDDAFEGILWVGDDTDGDGEIDFVHADIGSDGQYDYSAYKTREGWSQTNLVEAYLEMGFALPQPRGVYQKHDLDLIMNGVVVGSLRDVIPEGNYSFRLPPTAIQFNDEGVPTGNDVKIKSRHLNGGHYYLTSDFRIKVRMTGTRVWTVAESEDEARKKLLDTEGLDLEGPDYAISSAELRMIGNPAIGQNLVFKAPIRNVGATRTAALAAALMKDLGSGAASMVELARVYVEDVPLSGDVELSIPWTAVAGAHTLWVVLDPDGEAGDLNESNNRAAISCVVPGDAGPPSLQVLEPAEGFQATDTVVAVVVEASDDDRVLRVEVSVDGGLASPLDSLPEPGRYGGRVLLQPGMHRIGVTAIDGSNQRASRTVTVQVDAPRPEVAITSPEGGARIDEQSVAVRLRTSEDARLVAARVNGGPWRTGRLDGDGAAIDLDLPFGRADIEAMATDSRGARATARVSVTCTVQPEEKDKDEDEKDPPEDEKEPAVERPKGTIDVDGVGEIDALGPPDRPLPPVPGAREDAEDGAAGATNEGASGPGGGSAPPAERSRVGSAPATDAQPETLPPVRDLPEPPADEPEDEETPEDGLPEDETAPPVDPEEAELEDGEVLGGPPRPGPGAAGPAPAGRPSGGFIRAEAQQKDWYCTNRPEIEVKFRLPDWLRNKKLPKPGTKEFDAMMTRLLTDMRMRGFKMDRLERFQETLLRRIRRMNQPGELPGFLESFNIVGPKPEDPKALAEWRQKMENTAQAWFLRLLASGDPKLVAEGLKARAEAIGQFDQAMLEHAEAAVTEIEANQKIVEDVAEALPIVGEMSDIYAFVTGETALSGNQVSALERVIRLVGVVGPFGLEQLVKRSPNARMVLQALGEMGEAAGKGGKRMLASVLNVPPGKVDDTFAAIGKFLTKERKLIGETMEDKMAREARLFAKSPEGIADATRRLKDHAEARDLINKLKKSAPDSDDFRAAVKELQSNKTAQALINRADVPDALRKEAADQVKSWYKAADGEVAEGFEGLYRGGRASPDDTARIANELGITTKQAEDFQNQVEAFARKHGVDPSEVKVDKLNITNKRPPKPGEVPKTSFGRDRDVTFQIQAPMKDPNTGAILRDADGKIRYIGEDIDHVVSKNAYDNKFYTASGEGDLPRLPDGSIDQAKVSRYAEETMDQMVTSRWHPEAYNTGPVQLDDFLDKGITPTLTRVDDVCDTVAYKSDHWFKKADELAEGSSEAVKNMSKTERLTMASRNTAEGMRQATKQYDDLVLSRVRQYGLDPNLHVPPRLQHSMDIFRQVKDGAISPAKAEAMLKAIGTSKEGAVREMAGFLNGLEKTAGVGWRRVKSAELVNRIAGMKKAGGGWQDEAFEAINNSLKRGEILGTQFAKLRQNVSDGAVEAMKVKYPSEWKTMLKDWAGQAFQRRMINAAERAAFEKRAE